MERYRPKKDQKKALKKVISLFYEPIAEKQLVGTRPEQKLKIEKKEKQVKSVNKPDELS